MSEMTKSERDRFVERMLDHLYRLLLNRDMNEHDYYDAVLAFAEWEEAQLLKELESARAHLATVEAELRDQQKEPPQ
jgi:molybdopterin-biosynthesis enzyme MoeA-like protein